MQPEKPAPDRSPAGAYAMRIVAIVPFLNEARFLPRFLESVAAQTRTPDRLLLVDDGSTDDSHAIAADFAARHSFAVALRRPLRPPQRDRLATAAELEAFLWGAERIDEQWDVVAKLDGDLELTPETIAVLEQELERDPALGMAGSYLTEVDPSGTRARLRIRPEHVHGATKFYRRECYEQISPLPTIIGWDTIDEVKARLLGWRTQSFSLPGGDPLHLRKRASQDGDARGYRRSGEGAYALGEHPLHVLLLALRHMTHSAGPTGGLNYLAGWANAALRRFPRAEPMVRSHIRRDELQRIQRRLLRLGRQARTLLPAS
jgi:poly-beta-1,6-N-acetyl-D-glucosamine synthase